MDTMQIHYMHNEDPSYPPYPESRSEINPSLLVSWWCTLFAFVIILVRLGGRWIRTEQLFTEDKLMSFAIIPLFIRMVLIHFVFMYGTNNVVNDDLSAEDIANRMMGSKLVLAARIFYAMFIWIAKLTIADFLQRIFSQMWTKKHDYALSGIKWFLILTFLGVFVSTLAECQPFDGYWQVVPDPGPTCRDSSTQLIVMGVCDSITDLLLIGFPLPIIFSSNMKLERKLSLSLLFSLSLVLVGITIFRVQSTISHHYDQRFRSLIASFEILAATGVANAIVLGSFLRDRGIKKNKFKASTSGHDSVLDRPSNVLISARSHPAAVSARDAPGRGAHHVRGLHSWGSDVDLVSDLGMRLGPEFHAEKKPRLARPAPVALPMVPLGSDGRSLQRDWAIESNGEYNNGSGAAAGQAHPDFSDDEDEFDSSPPSPKAFSPRHVHLFDVGGLLQCPADCEEHGGNASPTRTRTRRRRPSSVSFAPLPSSGSDAHLLPTGPSAPKSPTRRNTPRERIGLGLAHPGGLSAFTFPPRRAEDQPATAPRPSTDAKMSIDSSPFDALDLESGSVISSTSFSAKKDPTAVKKD